MKIAFIVYRKSYYRFFVPLIQEGLNRGYEIECWHVYGRQKKSGIKSYTFPDLEDIPEFKHKDDQFKGKIIYGNEGLEKELLMRKDINAIISLHAPNYHLTQKTMESLLSLYCTAFSGGDSFVELKKILQERLDNRPRDIFFVPSEGCLKIGRDYLKRFSPKRSFLLEDRYRKIEVVGTIEFDGFKGIRGEEVRQKYKIPGNKSILLYLPFPFLNNFSWESAFCGILTNTVQVKDGSYIHDKKKNLTDYLSHKLRCLYRIVKDPAALNCWIKGINEEKVFNAVRDFCDKNNLYLVVKPRLKFPVAEIVKRKADLVVWDTEKQQDPPILKELLCLAKLTISYCSSSVLTSVFANVYHLNISLPDDFFNNDPVEKFWYSYEEPSFYDFGGVCESWRIEDVINNFGKTTLKRFEISPVQRLNYIKEYIGFDDYCASKRFFDSLEKNLPGR